MADPVKYENLFPNFAEALKAEQLAKGSSAPAPAVLQRSLPVAEPPKVKEEEPVAEEKEVDEPSVEEDEEFDDPQGGEDDIDLDQLSLSDNQD